MIYEIILEIEDFKIAADDSEVKTEDIHAKDDDCVTAVHLNMAIRLYTTPPLTMAKFSSAD